MFHGSVERYEQFIFLFFLRWCVLYIRNLKIFARTCAANSIFYVYDIEICFNFYCFVGLLYVSSVVRSHEFTVTHIVRIKICAIVPKIKRLPSIWIFIYSGTLFAMKWVCVCVRILCSEVERKKLRKKRMAIGKFASSDFFFFLLLVTPDFHLYFSLFLCCVHGMRGSCRWHSLIRYGTQIFFFFYVFSSSLKSSIELSSFSQHMHEFLPFVSWIAHRHHNHCLYPFKPCVFTKRFSLSFRAMLYATTVCLCVCVCGLSLFVSVLWVRKGLRFQI